MTQSHATDAQLDYWCYLCEYLPLKPDEWCFICPDGLGDTYLICALGAGFLKHIGGSFFSVIVSEQNLEIPHLFGRVIHQAITLQQIDFQAIHRFSRFAPGMPIICHPRYQPHGVIEMLRGLQNITPLSLYRMLLRLPSDTGVDRPLITQQQQLSAALRFAEFGLSQGKTVFLVPDSTELPLPPQFWLQLASELTSYGYTVVTLLTPGWAQALPGTTAVCFPLAEIIPAAELAGWVIASRTGLCEILSSAHCRFSIVYPHIPWQSGTALSALSLRRMGLSNHAMEYEVADASTCRMVIDDILFDE